MAELVRERDAYVAKKSATEAGGSGGDSFDRRVKETLQEQIIN